MSEGPVILVFGASGAVGRCFLQRTAGQGVRALAVSRRVPARSWSHVTWLQQDLERYSADVQAGTLVSFGPLAHALTQVEQSRGLGRVIALSSALPQLRRNARDRRERRRMAALTQCEEKLATACRRRNIVLTLLKPTEIYGGDPDCGVEQLATALMSLPVVPIAGRGLRQPVHADDLARLAVDCVVAGPVTAGNWLLAGGETLPFPDMLRRIAAARGRSIRLLRLPAWLVRAGLIPTRLTGRTRAISPAMIDRQQMDLVVDDTPAREKLVWNPRNFRPAGSEGLDA